MNFTLASWPFWIGLFVIGTVFYIIFAKPTYFKEPKGKNFSNPIHTKPLFKLGCIFILLYLMFMVVPAFITY